MKSSNAGKNISKSEVFVSGITQNGIWILLNGTEFNLPFNEFPWFKKANVEEMYNVRQTPSGNLRWDDLDVDIEYESLLYLDQYPLKFKK